MKTKLNFYSGVNKNSAVKNYCFNIFNNQQRLDKKFCIFSTSIKNSEVCD